MKKPALVLVAALVALVALAQTETPTVEETVSTLQSGLTNVPLEAALANITGWQAALEASEDPALQDLGGLLNDLAAELQAETINPAEVGGLLTSLGEGTTLAAEDAGDDPLAELGTLLAQAGASLVSGDASGGAASGGGM